MRKLAFLFSLLVYSLSFSVYSQNQKSIPKEQQPIPSIEEVSKAMGVYMGMFIKSGLNDIPGAEDLDNKIILQSIKDALEGKIKENETEAAYKLVEQYITAKQEERNQANKIAGENFLKENAQKEGVKTTESGLQYMILEEGNGPLPTVEDTVTIHYKGMLIDGEEFDSSYKIGQPAKFNPLQVIPGWTEGLCLLKEGTKARLFIPSKLGYGERGVGRKIPPYSVLIFDVEILKVTKGEPIPVAEARPAKSLEETKAENANLKK